MSFTGKHRQNHRAYGHDYRNIIEVLENVSSVCTANVDQSDQNG